MVVRVDDIRGLGPVKPHVRAAAVAIANRFGTRHIGGYATSGHITNSDHYKGLALDVMLNGPNKVRLGNQVAAWALARNDVTYVIWNRRINDRRNSKGWDRYIGTSPHTNHVHISFAASGSGSVGGSDMSGYLLNLPNPAEPLINFVKDNALRAAMIVGGFLLIAAALLATGVFSALKDVAQ